MVHSVDGEQKYLPCNYRPHGVIVFFLWVRGLSRCGKYSKKEWVFLVSKR